MVRVHNFAFFSSVIVGGDTGLGESYFRGDFDVSIRDGTVGKGRCSPLAPLPLPRQPAPSLLRILSTMKKRRHMREDTLYGSESS